MYEISCKKLWIAVRCNLDVHDTISVCVYTIKHYRPAISIYFTATLLSTRVTRLSIKHGSKGKVLARLVLLKKSTLDWQSPTSPSLSFHTWSPAASHSSSHDPLWDLPIPDVANAWEEEKLERPTVASWQGSERRILPLGLAC